MEETFCINHPELLAKRKCYLCKKPLCKKCIIKKHHHIFCSEECAKEYKKQLLIKNLKNKAKMPIPLPVLISIIIIAFGILFFIAYRFKDELFNLYILTFKERIPTPQSSIIKINPKYSEDFYSFKIFAPSGGFLLLSGKEEKFFYLPLKEKENYFSSFRALPPEYGVFLPNFFLNLKSGFKRSYTPLPFLSITFDGGATAGSSEEILEFLKKEKVEATFFLTGYFIKNNPDLVKKIENYGFEVGNHTLTHPHLTNYAINFKQETKEGINFEKLKEELESTNNLYKSITGKELKNFWRAPYGEYNEEIINWAWKAGYFHIGWSWDSLDWLEEENPNFEKRILKIKELKEKIKKDEKWLYGQILLFHLGNNNPEEIMEIINLIKSKNIKTVPISTLLATDTFYKAK